MQTRSDVHDHSFGQAYGVLIEGLPLPLLSRAVFVVDKDGKISYAEYVPEVTSHPTYDNAVQALRDAAGCTSDSPGGRGSDGPRPVWAQFTGFPTRFSYS